MTTNKDLQNLYDLRFSIKDLKAEFERNPLTNGKFGSLISTTLVLAYHWASDLVFEMEARDLKEAKERAEEAANKLEDSFVERYQNAMVDRNAMISQNVINANWERVQKMNCLLRKQALWSEKLKSEEEKFKEMQEQAKQVLEKANAPKTGE